MKTQLKLSRRLLAAASMASDGTVADIGTDHALLPIYLVKNGHGSALASDINKGPCKKAAENIALYGLEDKIRVVCRPGLDGIEDFSPDNIFICGMGGEMIADILTASDYPRKSGCKLILQPMSMQDVLRKQLLTNGFEIIEEKVVLDSRKFYELISARYTGQKLPELSYAEYRLGRLNIERALRSPDETDIKWLEFIKNAAEERIAGRELSKVGNRDNSEDSELVELIDKILSANNHTAGGNICRQ